MRLLVMHGGARVLRFVDRVRVFTWLFGIVGIAVGVSGCSTIEVHTEGKVDVYSKLGFPVVYVEHDHGSTIVKTTSLGLVASPALFNIGYLNETYYLPDDQCELVLFEPSVVNMKELAELVGATNGVCATRGVYQNEVE